LKISFSALLSIN